MTDKKLKMMERCLSCKRENYAQMVLSGKCAWCGFNINDKSHIKKLKKMQKDTNP